MRVWILSLNYNALQQTFCVFDSLIHKQVVYRHNTGADITVVINILIGFHRHKRPIKVLV